MEHGPPIQKDCYGKKTMGWGGKGLVTTLIRYSKFTNRAYKSMRRKILGDNNCSQNDSYYHQTLKELLLSTKVGWGQKRRKKLGHLCLCEFKRSIYNYIVPSI